MPHRRDTGFQPVPAIKTEEILSNPSGLTLESCKHGLEARVTLKPGGTVSYPRPWLVRTRRHGLEYKTVAPGKS